MPQHSVERSSHGEEEIDLLYSIHPTGKDGYGGDVVKKQQLAFTSRNDNQDIATWEPVISLETTQDNDTSDGDVSDSTSASTPDTTPPPTPSPSTPGPSTPAAFFLRPDPSLLTWIPDEYLDLSSSSDEDSDWDDNLQNDNGFMVSPDTSVDSDDGYSSDISWASWSDDDDNYRQGRCWSRPKFLFPLPRNHSTSSGLKGNQSSPDYNHMAAAASKSRLESLPAELRIKILSNMPDLGTLHAIIHASPMMYQQYLYDRNRILVACMEREFEGFFADAYANLQFRSGEMRSNYECEERYYDKKLTTRFLYSYRHWLKAPDSSPGPGSLSPKRLRWMLAYHMSVARPLVREYGSWALRNLRQAGSHTTDTMADAQDDKLSRSEEIRIFRALYRYDTFLRSFRPARPDLSSLQKMFFGLFDPWEVDAIDCMTTFIKQQWNDLFDRIQDDMEPDKYESRNGYWNPGVEIELRTGRKNHVKCMLLRGLETLAHMRRIKDYPTLLSTSDNYLPCCVYHCFSMKEKIQRHGSSKFQNYVPGDPVRFPGDLLPPDGPPLAWVRLREGKYGGQGKYDVRWNPYERPHVPTPLKRWGFVMWDAKRFADMGSEGLIAKELGHPVCRDGTVRCEGAGEEAGGE